MRSDPKRHKTKQNETYKENIMITCVAHLKSASPYSQSRFHNTPQKAKEGNGQKYEERTWREKCHYNEEGNIFIPPTQFSFALTETAGKLGVTVPGKKGNPTYKKYFLGGILVIDPIVLPEKKDTVTGEWFYCHVSGARNTNKRVLRCFPMIYSWEGDLTVYITDLTITPDVLLQHLTECGQSGGVGRYRPACGGTNGRFSVEKFEYSQT
jgi:hypothetical protein